MMRFLPGVGAEAQREQRTIRIASLPSIGFGIDLYDSARPRPKPVLNSVRLELKSVTPGGWLTFHFLTSDLIGISAGFALFSLLLF